MKKLARGDTVGAFISRVTSSLTCEMGMITRMPTPQAGAWLVEGDQQTYAAV